MWPESDVIRGLAGALAYVILAGCGGTTPSNQQEQRPPAESCKQILEFNPDIESGEYLIDPDRSGDEFQQFKVQCDMETDGGGWTKITPCIAREQLKGTLVAGMEANKEKFDDKCRPWTQDNRKHSYHYTIQFPGGFQEFYLANYKAKNTTDTPNQLGFSQQTWVQAYRNGAGDISFGSGVFSGPETSFSRQSVECDSAGCVLDWPENEKIYSLDFARSNKDLSAAFTASGSSSLDGDENGTNDDFIDTSSVSDLDANDFNPGNNIVVTDGANSVAVEVTAVQGGKVLFKDEILSSSSVDLSNATTTADGHSVEFLRDVGNFRIGWGESSVVGPSPEPNPEGWYPWWKGAIWVR